MKRNDFIDQLKGSLIMLVCIGHAIQYAIYQDHNFWTNPVYKAIYMFHMPLFMAVAGYLSQNGLTNTPSLRNYLTRRSLSLLIPVFSWALLAQGVITIASSHASFHDFSIAFLSKAQHHLWFLWALFIALILTGLGRSIHKHQAVIPIILLGIALLLPESHPVYLFKYTFPFFIAGFLLAGADFHRPSDTTLKAITYSLAPLCLACFFLWTESTYVQNTGMSLTPDTLPTIVFRWLTGGIASLFFILLLYFGVPLLPDGIKHFLRMAGRQSIYIYILQAGLFYTLFRLTDNLVLFRTSNLLLDNCVAIVIGLAITMACLQTSLILSKNRLIAFLLFGKQEKPA